MYQNQQFVSSLCFSTELHGEHASSVIKKDRGKKMQFYIKIRLKLFQIGVDFVFFGFEMRNEG